MTAEPEGFNYGRFATLAGLTAQALAPDSFGGRLGGAAARLGIHEADQAYRERLEKERQRQAMLRGLMSRRGGAVAPGYTIPPENRDPNQPYTSPLTPRLAAPPSTSLGSSRPGYTVGGVEYPAVEGEFSPREQQLRPPPATALGASRPAYGEYPAVEGQFSPRQSVVPLKPAETGYIPGATEQYTAPLIPSQAAPPATARTASRPAYIDPVTGEVYPAVGPLFTPREEAVIGAPGSTIIPSPGAPPIVAQPTARQSTVTLTPGATAYQPGEKRGLVTAPYSPAQKAGGAKQGLRTVKPDETVIDAQGKVIYQRGPSTKAEKPTTLSIAIETFRRKFEELEDIKMIPGRFWNTPGQTREEQALKKMNNLTGTQQAAAEEAFRQVFDPKAAQAPAAAKPVTPKRFRFDAQGNLLQ